MKQVLTRSSVCWKRLGGVMCVIACMSGGYVYAQAPTRTPSVKATTTPTTRLVVDVDVLLRKLSSENIAVQLGAIRRLSGVKHPKVREALFGRLHVPSKVVRKEALFALYRNHKKALRTYLLKMLRADTWFLRGQAAEGIGLLKWQALRAVLQKRLQKDAYHGRLGAAMALGELGDTSSSNVFLKMLRDRDMEVRKTAAYVCWLARVKRALPALVQALQDPTWGVRFQAERAVRQLGGERTVPAVIALLQDKREKVRRIASRLLGAFGGALAYKGLQRALGDKGRYVRVEAARALGRLRGRRSLMILQKALQAEQADVVRAAIVASIVKVSGPSELSYLNAIFKDKSPYVRQHFVLACRALDKQTAHALLKRALRDPVLQVRTAAKLILREKR